MLCGKMRKAKLLHYRGIKIKKIFSQWFPTYVQFRIICKLIRGKQPLFLPNSLAKKPPKEQQAIGNSTFPSSQLFWCYVVGPSSLDRFLSNVLWERGGGGGGHLLTQCSSGSPASAALPNNVPFAGRNGKGDLLWVSKRNIRHPSG